jgi:hypothetical protein
MDRERRVIKQVLVLCFLLPFPLRPSGAGVWGNGKHKEDWRLMDLALT